MIWKWGHFLPNHSSIFLFSPSQKGIPILLNFIFTQIKISFSLLWVKMSFPLIRCLFPLHWHFLSFSYSTHCKNKKDSTCHVMSTHMFGTIYCSWAEWNSTRFGGQMLLLLQKFYFVGRVSCVRFVEWYTCVSVSFKKRNSQVKRKISTSRHSNKSPLNFNFNILIKEKNKFRPK